MVNLVTNVCQNIAAKSAVDILLSLKNVKEWPAQKSNNVQLNSITEKHIL